MTLASFSGQASVIKKERAHMANPLTVRVSAQVSLDAGTWEERLDQQQQPYRLITPPASTMYEQLLAYLIDAAKEQKIRPPSALDFAEVAIATVAVCIRWGSYFAVLNNSELPLWAASKTASCIADSEMARLNIEMSAAVAHWISLIDSDNNLFRTLVKAALQLLPFPSVTIDPSASNKEFRLSTFFNLQQEREGMMSSMKQVLGDDFVEWKRQSVLAHPHSLRTLANGILLEFWRNGPIEDMHGGTMYVRRPVRHGSQPVTQRRISPDAEKTVLAETTGRLVPLLHGLYPMITGKSEATLIEKLLPYAILFQSPATWSLTEKTHVVALPGKEP
jgi:hypothetical protein